MSILSRTLSILILISITILPSTVVFADLVGEQGKIKTISLNSSASDDFGSFHGYIILDTQFDEVFYYWGGAYCPGIKFITEENRHLLSALMECSEIKATIKPNYKIGQGNNHCLVGFTCAIRLGAAHDQGEKYPPVVTGPAGEEIDTVLKKFPIDSPEWIGQGEDDPTLSLDDETSGMSFGDGIRGSRPPAEEESKGSDRLMLKGKKILEN